MTAYNTISSTYAPNYWLPYAQAAITAIRAVDATTPIYVQGVGVSSAFNWQWNNWEFGHATGGNLVFEAHQYFDTTPPGEGPGEYSGTYTSYGVSSTTGVTEATPFVQRLQTVGAKGIVGEFNVPNNTNDNDPHGSCFNRTSFNIWIKIMFPLQCGSTIHKTLISIAILRMSLPQPSPAIHCAQGLSFLRDRRAKRIVGLSFLPFDNTSTLFVPASGYCLSPDL